MNYLERLKKMDDATFIRYMVAEAAVIYYSEGCNFSTAEEWAEWMVEEHESNIWCNRNISQLAVDHKYYIEECIASINEILEKYISS